MIEATDNLKVGDNVTTLDLVTKGVIREIYSTVKGVDYAVLDNGIHCNIEFLAKVDPK